LSQWMGREVIVRVDKLPENSGALDALVISDDLKNANSIYREPLRPQFHFSSKCGWLNDPNGLVYHDGQYHLFYQHNPFGWSWGNMHWGHAISSDLVHWEELGDALHPDEMGPMFSGSGVVDWMNTSGLGVDGNPPLAFFYTAAGNPTVQCLATSTDGGRTLVKFSGNPILKQITAGNRDPKVIWHAPSKQWIMTLYVGHEGADKDANGKPKRRDTIQFLKSSDLKTWTYLSENAGYYECPDFFELPLDGDATRRKWVLTAANSDYQVGRFDGKVFTPETPMLKGVRGRGFYAAQTYSDVPAEDGRRIQIGWLRADSPDMPFNQCMSLPLELRLVTQNDGPRLTWTPVKELEGLRAKTNELAMAKLAAGDANPLAAIKADLLELEVECGDPANAESLTFNLHGRVVTIDLKKREVRSGDIVTALESKSGPIKLHFYCDRTTVEIFGDDGLTYMTIPALAKPDDLGNSLKAGGGEVRGLRLIAHELHSTW
ncbi:MAG: glycoside hydrolase family 32 protein, partial [Chthoniobacteraceae bacterium]